MNESSHCVGLNVRHHPALWLYSCAAPCGELGDSLVCVCVQQISSMSEQRKMLPYPDTVPGSAAAACVRGDLWQTQSSRRVRCETRLS